MSGEEARSRQQRSQQGNPDAGNRHVSFWVSTPVENWLFRRFGAVLRGCGGRIRQNARAKQGKTGPAVHLPLDGFQAIDLAFDLTAAPG